MKLPPFEFVQPHTVAQAIDCLMQDEGEARVLAGGQSLLPMLALRVANPTTLVGLERIDALNGAQIKGDVLVLGALTTHAMVEDGAVADVTAGMMRHVAAGIAWRPVRVRGTIGGSLAHADPSADWPVALTALGASVLVQGPEGQRRIPVETLGEAAFSTALQPGEVLIAIEVPVRAASMRWTYHKIARKSGEFADAIVAIVIDPASKQARVVLGGLPAGPRRLEAVEKLLSDASIRHSADFDRPWAERQLEAIDTTNDPVMQRIRATALYRAVREVLQ
ncbi:MAG: FAD binding domain-containing protein [Burkholderiales bacterium]|nr:FAD binding domain-containing protein [Burkholderiales bacterium]